MEDIAGKPLLGHLISRVQRAKKIDDIIIATSIRSENDIIEAYCDNIDVNCFRGDEDDVLGRTLGALKYMNADIGVEVFGDCPLIDPDIIDFIIGEYQQNYSDYDFVGNDLETTFPPGMEVEVFKLSALERANQETVDPSIREHGTLAIRQAPETYTIMNLPAIGDWNRPELELEVDTPEDFEVIKTIIHHFNSIGNHDFSLSQIIYFLDNNPIVAKSNQHIERRWKTARGCVLIP